MILWCIENTTQCEPMAKTDRTARNRRQIFNKERPLSGRLPPLTMLRAFEATGRTGSMRKAARDIGVSHTVVSRHIQNLEAWIGWKLLDAGPRGATLTAEGQSLYAATSGAFHSIAGVAAQLRSSAGVDELHIWCVPGLATRWLTPRLASIREVVCGEVLLRAVDRMPDINRGEADVMIGFGDFGNLPDQAVALVQPRMFPVASAAWLGRHGMPASIEEMISLPLIHEESYAQWTRWFQLAGVAVERKLEGPRLWDANLGFDAALTGQGVALSSNLLVAREIGDGRLVELFETDIRVGGYFLTISPGSRNDPRILKFRDWLERTLHASDASFEIE